MRPLNHQNRIILCSLISLFTFCPSSGHAGSKKKLANKVSTDTKSNRRTIYEDPNMQKPRFQTLKLENRGQIEYLNDEGKTKQLDSATEGPYGEVGTTHDALKYKGNEDTPERDKYAVHTVLNSANAGYAPSSAWKKKSPSAVVSVCDGIMIGNDDPSQVHKTSDEACKKAIEKINSFSDADELKRALPGIVSALKTDLEKQREKGNLKGDTTISVGKAFRNENGSYRYVGINIGDSGVIAVNHYKWGKESGPRAKIWTVSRPARRPGTTGSPIGILSSEFDLQNDLQIVDESNLPSGSVLVGLSDGAYEPLGTITKKKGRPFSRDYLEITGAKPVKGMQGQKGLSFRDRLDKFFGGRGSDASRVATAQGRDRLTPAQVVGTIRAMTLEQAEAAPKRKKSSVISIIDPKDVTDELCENDRAECKKGKLKFDKTPEQTGAGDFTAVGIMLP